MAIEYRQGNLLHADAEALVNTVNCVGVMGKGIALQFKQAYPENFQQYQRACHAGTVRPGQMLTVPIGNAPGPTFVINFPTKRHWKDPSRIEDIKTGLDSLIEEIRRLGLHSIAIPPLGCGLGGLRWAEVASLIEAAFAALPEVRVLVYPPQQAPETEDMPVRTERPAMTRGRALFLRSMELYGIPGYELTRLEIQKLAYFLQAAGEPLRLSFVKHLYGPYAEQINHVLQRMEGHFIRGYGDRSARQGGIRLLPGAAEEARQYLAGQPEALGRMERVAGLIEGFETPYGMELLATVHWVVAQEEPAAVDQVERVVAGVHGWSERKRERFRAEHIRAAWQRLSGQGWLRSPTP